jgi:signal recognition particle GTPase
MARGWESKSVEAQQAEAGERSVKKGPKLSAKDAARIRQRETLRLSRQRVLQQIEATQNPRHRKLLQQALDELEEKLAEPDL